MNKLLGLAVAVWLAALTLAGCASTAPIQVDPSDPAELEAVGVYGAKQEDYRFRLSVLEAHYKRTGNLDKLRWARREMENLQETMEAVQFKPAPQFVPPKGEPVVDRDERVLVDTVIESRKEYLAAVEDLRELYRSSGDAQKLAKFNEMMEAFNPIRTYMYFLDAEIPSASLHPTVKYAEADRLFQEAMDYHKGAKGVLGVGTDRKRQAWALQKLRTLVDEYPDSTQIPLAAYYIAEIYKEYFDENVRAVHWYERAWQWDPQIPQPARFQAATVYDFRLNNVPKAVALYREAIQHDPYRLFNEDFARGRINELTAPQK